MKPWKVVFLVMDSNQLAAGSEGARYLEYVGVTGAAVRYYELQIKVVQWRGRPPGPRGRCGTNIYYIFRENCYEDMSTMDFTT